MRERQNVAAAIGGWSVRHRVGAVVGWVVFVVVAVAVGTYAGQVEMTADQYAEGDSARVEQVLDDAGLRTPASEMFLVTTQDPVTSPQGRAAVADLVRRLRQSSAVESVTDPFAAGLVSADGRSALVQMSMTGDPMTAGDRAQPLLDAAAATRAAHPAATVDEFGDGSANQWFDDTILKDFRGPSGRRCRWRSASWSSPSARCSPPCSPSGWR